MAPDKSAATSSHSCCGHRFGIRFKMAAFIAALLVLLMVVDSLWNLNLQSQQAEKEAFEKAQVLAAEMRAAWDFVDINQDTLNRNEDGTFRSKNLVCVVAAKSISMLFSLDTDYSIRFTACNPRQKANAPDDFENAALVAFEENPDLEAYWGIEESEDGSTVFRYLEPLLVTESCLECHGDPVGELDQYGYAKEGMQVGDIGGAMSITEPMDIYDEGVQNTVFQQVFMVMCMLVVAFVAMYFITSFLVLKPIDTLRRAAQNVGDGTLAVPEVVQSKSIGGPDEITELTDDFNRMGAQLRDLYENLEGQVQSKTNDLMVLNDMLNYQKTELKKALDRLQEETSYKNEFFAMVSHELRTPLTSILAFARMLRENDGLDPKTMESVTEIEVNATNLLDLVNNLLAISRQEAKRERLLLEPVDFVDLVGVVKKSLQPLADVKSVQLTARADADVPLTMADWEKLRRILENLTNNAIKYTHEGGWVSVSVHFVDDTIYLEVADDGIGIDPADIDQIFELYKQAEQSSNRRYKGTGLGLSVVKQLAELHGGRVSVVSERKQGSVFTVEIPYVPVEAEDDDEDFTC